MKRIIASLAIMLILMGSTTLAADFCTVFLGNVGNETRVVDNLDSSQPDTILYDVGSGQYFLTIAVNYWGTVRFTAPADFELRSVYVQGLNRWNNQSGCSVYIHADNGAGNPGTLLGGPYQIPGPFTSYVFSDAEVVPSINFTEGTDFHVIYGPAPGGPDSLGYGWYLWLDGNGNTNSRSGYSANQGGPWNRALPGDLMVRAGGILESYTDLTCLSTFTDPAHWFVDAGTVMTVKAEVENVGTENIAAYTINWTARNASGTTVWTATGSYGALASGASAIQTASTTFTPPAAGYYEIEGNAIATGDANPDNNVNSMELGVGGLGFDWLKFDDGSFESTISFSGGGGWGQRFDPVDYPVQVDSIKVGLGAAKNVTDIRIYYFNPILTQFTQLWQYTGAVVQNWNTFSFDPDEIVIFDGGVVVTYLYQADCPMQKDDDPPTAAANGNMPWTATQISGGSFYEEESGDWAFRCFVSETQAIPPDPVIAASADTLSFGAVTIGTNANMSLWVKNVGGGDMLQVTNIQFIPVPISPAYSATPTNFSVAQGDSVEVVVNFHPAAEQAYNGVMGILNNTSVTPFMVRVEGSGTTLGVHDPDQGTMPTNFSLAQNYPNPFNPSTEIRFALPVGSNVTLTIFNTLGQEVATVTDGHYDAGYHSVMWDASHLSSGIYFYRLEAGNYSDMKKMVLMK